MKLMLTHLNRSILVALVVVFFTACSDDSKKTIAETTKEKTDLTLSPQNEADTAEIKTDTAETSQPATGEVEEVTPLEKPEIKPVISTTSNGSGGLAARVVSDNKLATMLEKLARAMEAKKLAYVSSLGQDCSGIFHQIKDSVQVRMPALADKSSYTYPSFGKDRNSRQIADWYYRNSNLLIVQDALADGNKIRPGSVMFFGRTDEKYSNMDIELLTNPGKFVHDGSKGKIMHVAVVTSVEKDEQGNVTKYTMMHGRNSKYTASRTGCNYDGPGSYKKQFAKFPFGNWNQQWVAMAHIETPVK
ncbi:MAG: hypothetical protein DHS20C18_38090 [Saprospiraceae bacterium]|nr:MAG: hypothetical protein DHS20C18_38090 [Saprospiraceae bacterium]